MPKTKPSFSQLLCLAVLPCAQHHFLVPHAKQVLPNLFHGVCQSTIQKMENCTVHWNKTTAKIKNLSTHLSLKSTAGCMQYYNTVHFLGNCLRNLTEYSFYSAFHDQKFNTSLCSILHPFYIHLVQMLLSLSWGYPEKPIINRKFFKSKMHLMMC